MCVLHAPKFHIAYYIAYSRIWYLCLCSIQLLNFVCGNRTEYTLHSTPLHSAEKLTGFQNMANWTWTRRNSNIINWMNAASVSEWVRYYVGRRLDAQKTVRNGKPVSVKHAKFVHRMRFHNQLLANDFDHTEYEAEAGKVNKIISQFCFDFIHRDDWERYHAFFSVIFSIRLHLRSARVLPIRLRGEPIERLIFFFEQNFAGNLFREKNISLNQA